MYIIIIPNLHCKHNKYLYIYIQYQKTPHLISEDSISNHLFDCQKEGNPSNTLQYQFHFELSHH